MLLLYDKQIIICHYFHRGYLLLPSPFTTLGLHQTTYNYAHISTRSSSAHLQTRNQHLYKVFGYKSLLYVRLIGQYYCLVSPIHFLTVQVSQTNAIKSWEIWPKINTSPNHIQQLRAKFRHKIWYTLNSTSDIVVNWVLRQCKRLYRQAASLL